MIDGVKIIPLKQIADERGKVMHMLRNDDEGFEQFGEIYFSLVYPGVVKGWHRHHEMGLTYAVPVGMVKLVCYDDRPGSRTHGNVVEIHTGELSYEGTVKHLMKHMGFTRGDHNRASRPRHRPSP